jgi:hypothetical protein
VPLRRSSLTQRIPVPPLLSRERRSGCHVSDYSCSVRAGTETDRSSLRLHCVILAAVTPLVAMLTGCGGTSFHVHPKTEFPLVGDAHVVDSVELPTGLGPEHERWAVVTDPSMTRSERYRQERAEFQGRGWPLRGAHGGPCDQAWVSPQDDLVRYCPTRRRWVRPAPAKARKLISPSRRLRRHELFVAMVPDNSGY